MNDHSDIKSAKEYGLEIDYTPLLGGAYVVTVSGMLGNSEDHVIWYDLFWRGKLVAEFSVLPRSSVHVHHVVNTMGVPTIEDFQVKRTSSDRTGDDAA